MAIFHVVVVASVIFIPYLACNFCISSRNRPKLCIITPSIPAKQQMYSKTGKKALRQCKPPPVRHFEFQSCDRYMLFPIGGRLEPSLYISKGFRDTCI